MSASERLPSEGAASGTASFRAPRDELIYEHIENKGYAYSVGVIVVQAIFFFVSCALPPLVEHDIDSTEYQHYNILALSFMLATQLYFLVYAVKKNSPSDMFSFIIMGAMYTVYMIFRDIVFVRWPWFFMVHSKEH